MFSQFSRETTAMRIAEQTGQRGLKQSLRSRRRAPVAVIAILATFAGLAISKLPLPASQTAKYRVAVVEKGSVVSAIPAAGTVKPLDAILVGCQGYGQITVLAAGFNSREAR